MWRHGDVLIASVGRIPNGVRRLPGAVLAWGEITGHSHRIEDDRSAELYARDDVMYIRVTAPEARLVHEEQLPIVLPQGDYKFWFQREYTPEAIKRIID